MMIPQRRLLWLIALLCALALLWALSNLLPRALGDLLALLTSSGAVLLALVAAVDALRLWRLPAPRGSRQLPPAFTAGVAAPVTVQLVSAGLSRRTQVVDHPPSDDPHTGLPQWVTPADAAITELTYHYRPQRRGEACFGALELWLTSPWGLWLRRHRVAAAAQVAVYPDVRWLSQEALFQASLQRQLSGSHRRQHQGDGQEFHQLRDYQAGDALRQIDWSATARRHALVSREFREDTNRHLVLLVDGSQRLAAGVGERTAFDHALDAALLLATQALNQGDRPGLLLVNGSEPLWVPPLHSRAQLHQLLGQLYRVQPSRFSADYSEAASTLLRRWRRQAVVILITRLQPDDLDDLLHATRLLRGRTRLLIGDVVLPDEAVIQDADAETVDQALALAGLARYQQEREQLYARLRHAGVFVVSAPPASLTRRLNHLYLSLRRSGRL